MVRTTEKLSSCFGYSINTQAICRYYAGTWDFEVSIQDTVVGTLRVRFAQVFGSIPGPNETPTFLTPVSVFV